MESLAKTIVRELVITLIRVLASVAKAELRRRLR